MSKTIKKGVVEVNLFGHTEEVTLPITAKKLTEKFPDYLFFTDESALEFTAMNPSTHKACKINASGELMYYMDTTTTDSIDTGTLTSDSILSTTASTSSAFDSSLWTTSSSPLTVGSDLSSIDWSTVYPSYPSGGYATSGYVDVRPSYYAEDMMPHLVRAKEEGTRQKIEMDTVVLDRGVAKSCGLDHADMILGLKVKYAKPGSLPMDSAFILLKDEKAAASDKEKIRALEKEIAELEKALDKRTEEWYAAKDDYEREKKRADALRGIAIKRGEMLAGDDSDADAATVDEPRVVKISRGGETMKIALPTADHAKPAPVLRAVSGDMMKPREELDGKYCEVTLNDHKVNIILRDVLDISQNYSADGWESMEVTLFDGWSTDKILIHDRRDAEALFGAVVA